MYYYCSIKGDDDGADDGSARSPNNIFFPVYLKSEGANNSMTIRCTAKERRSLPKNEISPTKKQVL